MGDHEPESELTQLAREVRKLVEENRTFLDRIMDDDFEPEDDGESGGDQPVG